MGEYISAEEIKDPNDLTLWLKVNGTMKQNGNTSDMIFKYVRNIRQLTILRIPEIISHISSIMTLEEGDLILTGMPGSEVVPNLTGTPAGVGEVKPGDTITAGIKELAKYDIKFSVVQE